MRTILVLVGGLASLAAVLAVSRLLGGDARQTQMAALAFLAAWFVFLVSSFRSGLRAGYGLGPEIAIHALLLGIPALATFLALRFLVTREA